MPYVNQDGRRMAIRLEKSPRANTASSSTITSNAGRIDAVEWQVKILSPDLQNVGDWSLLPSLMRIEGAQEDLRPFLRQIAAKIEPLRPLERRRLTGIDEEQTKALFITEDLSAISPNVSSLIFEIKPKCGFLPPSAYLSASTEPYKKKHSRFRMHSIHKDSSLSAEDFAQLYDPLDLFDGSEERLEKAAKALFASWQQGKGNNLRVFIDGHIVSARSDDKYHAEAQEVASKVVKGDNSDALYEVALSVLGSAPVRKALITLCSLQQRYDPIDVEGVNSACKQEFGKALNEINAQEITIEEYERVVHKASSELGCMSARELIAAFLLSTMYKDCSLFIRLTLTSDQPEICVHLVDLDPKPIGKLAYLYEIDQQIVSSFAAWQQSQESR